MDTTTEQTTPKIQQVPPENPARPKISFYPIFLPVYTRLLSNGIGLLIGFIIITFIGLPQIPIKDHRFINWSILLAVIISVLQLYYGFVLLKKKKRTGTIEFNDKKGGYILLFAGNTVVIIGLALFMTLSLLYRSS